MDSVHDPRDTLDLDDVAYDHPVAAAELAALRAELAEATGRLERVRAAGLRVDRCVGRYWAETFGVDVADHLRCIAGVVADNAAESLCDLRAALDPLSADGWRAVPDQLPPTDPPPGPKTRCIRVPVMERTIGALDAPPVTGDGEPLDLVCGRCDRPTPAADLADDGAGVVLCGPCWGVIRAAVEGDPLEAEYFVLDLIGDEHAPAALRTYAAECRGTRPALAAALEARFGALSSGPGVPRETALVDRLVAAARDVCGFAAHHHGDPKSGRCVVSAPIMAALEAALAERERSDQ